jgi:rod shape-determining protein MreC
MQQIIFFFIRNKNFLLFGILFVIAFFLTIQSHSFHNSKFVTSANFLSGSIYNTKKEITGYFGLKEQNSQLVEENIRLRKTLESYQKAIPIPDLDSTILPNQYRFVGAEVINNNYSKTKNQLTINKGSKDSILLDMGVITSKGLVGIVNNVTKNYARIQSILNTNSQINAKLKKSNQFGFLTWNTKDPNVIQLIEIPRIAQLVVGDTIVTGGKSSIFPKGILIGTIKDFKLSKDDSYIVDVLLFNDMTNLGHVYAIENKDIEEIEMLEKEVENAEQ